MKHNRISSVYLCKRDGRVVSLYFKFRGENSGFGYALDDDDTVFDVVGEVLSLDEHTIDNMITCSFSARKKKYTMERIK